MKDIQNFVVLDCCCFDTSAINLPTQVDNLALSNCLVSRFLHFDQVAAESFFRSVLGQMETVYLNRNPTPKSVLELVRSVDDEQLCYDHLAFRTFGV